MCLILVDYRPAVNSKIPFSTCVLPHFLYLFLEPKMQFKILHENLNYLNKLYDLNYLIESTHNVLIRHIPIRVARR